MSDARTNVLSALARDLDADFACLAELDGDAGRIAKVSTAGDATTGRAWQGITGAPVARMARSWRPERPRAAELNRFSRLIVDATAQERHPGLAWIFDRYYRPFGLGVQLRALLYEGDSFLGYLMVARVADRAPFRAREPEAVTALARARRALDAVWADAMPEGVGYAVIPSDGSLARVQVSLGLSTWATTTRRRSLVEVARAFARGGPPIAYVDGAPVECTPLLGNERAVHVTVRPPRRIRLDQAHRLSERQRVVAELAVKGATVPEIARHLSVAESTVKEHLRAIYERLGVASRVELASRLGVEGE